MHKILHVYLCCRQDKYEINSTQYIEFGNFGDWCF